MRHAGTRSLLILLLFVCCARASASQAGFFIYGRVSLPNGQPANRVDVFIEGFNGLNRQTRTDDQGRYEFFAVPGGRYRLKASDPADSSLIASDVEADTSRTSGNRLVVHIYMRKINAPKQPSPKPGVLSVEEALQPVPKEARKAFEQGLKYQEEKKPDRARASFDRAVEIYPEYFQALSARGELHIGGGKIDEATRDFESALKFNESYAPALRGIGYCRLEQQNYAEAARYLVRALETEPNNANSHLFLGIALLALNQTPLAKEAFAQALKLDAEASMTAHVYLADVYARDRQYKEAADELDIYLKARPNAAGAERLKARRSDLRTRAGTSQK